VGSQDRVPRLKPDEFADASRERFQAEARFYTELEHRTFADMKRLLRKDLGVGSLLVGTADHNDSYSAFGHIEANLQRGVVTVDTPRSQAMVGFLGGTELTTRHLSVDLENPFAAVQLTSVDDLPIAKSQRLLLTTTAQMSNTGFRWESDRQTVAEWGKGPVRIEPVSGVVRVHELGHLKTLRARPLAANGTPLGRTIAATQSRGVWSLRLGAPPALWYLIDLER
jgi:hypothetical protein